jgi:hypothetical protein
LLAGHASFGALGRFCLALVEGTSQGVGWAAAATVQDMRVDHGRPNVLVAEQLLDRANGASYARHRSIAKGAAGEVDLRTKLQVAKVRRGDTPLAFGLMH